MEAGKKRPTETDIIVVRGFTRQVIKLLNERDTTDRAEWNERVRELVTVYIPGFAQNYLRDCFLHRGDTPEDRFLFLLIRQLNCFFKDGDVDIGSLSKKEHDYLAEQMLLYVKAAQKWIERHPRS